VLNPAPDTVYQIPYRYQTTYLAVSTTGTQAVDLSATTDEPIVPRRYRLALVYWAVGQWYRDRKDDARSESANAEYTDIVSRMAGDFGLDSDRPRLKIGSLRRRYLAGAAGSPRRGGRYSTGSWFDEVR